MDSGDPALARIAYLMVVQRGELERFRFLCSTFRDPSVEVVWDRRVAERRATTMVPASDRRRADRRSSTPPSWNNLGFLVARRKSDTGEPPGSAPAP